MVKRHARLFALLPFILALCLLAHARRSTAQTAAPHTAQPSPAQAGASATPAPPAQSADAAKPGQPHSLTPQERRGKAIYLRGESPTGRELTALVGELDVPASTLTCAGCHGVAGEGKTEGGVTAGGLTWAHLTKTYGHTHPTGRKHGPFDEASFVRAVTEGVDPAGNKMLVAMPRYKISPEELADVIAYLKRIDTDRDPGLTETSIRVGTVLPLAGPLGEAGQAMRDVLAAYFEDLNSRGGIYNRRVELRVASTGPDAAATAASFRRLLTDEQVFAFVGGMTAGADKEAVALMQAEGTPLVGPATLLPLPGSLENRYTFYLLPGVREQARALVRFAGTRAELKKLPAAIVYPDLALNSEAAASIEEQAKKDGWTNVVKAGYNPQQFDAAKVVETLKAQGAGAVFFLGAGGTEKALLQAAERAGYAPTVFLLGMQIGSGLAEAVTPAFRDKVFISFPSVPADITPAAVEEFRALAAKYKFAPRHTAFQFSAFAAAKIFVEGLKLAGRDLSREKLVTALEGLYDYETGVTPHVTFGPNRRVGAQGAYIVTVNPDKREFAVVGDWVSAN